MAFSSRTCLDKFYAALGKSPFDFQYHCQNAFFPALKQPMMRGGPSRARRQKVIQEAVDALQMYAKIGNVTDAADKRYRFETTYNSFFKSRLPANSPTAGVQAAKMQLLAAQFYVLEEKFKLLDYWQAVAVGTTQPDYPDDGAHWAMHELLQFDPLTVRPILELMLDDAAHVLNQRHFTAEMSVWKGAETQVTRSFTKSGMARTLCFAASARAGVEGQAHFEMNYTGLKVAVDANLFAGARGKVEGSVNVSQSGVSAKGKVEAELGIRFQGSVDCTVLDVLEAGATIDAMAGAMGSLEGEFTIDYQGLKVKVGAEAFAGVKVTASAHGTLKLGNREVTSAKITGSAMAGVGASAGAHFECGIFGKVSFGAKAGAVLGTGAEVDTAVSIDFHNIHWGATNLFWMYVNEHGYKNKGKVWFLPVEENVQMCTRARDRLFLMMGDLYQRNEAEMAMLERWDMIEKRLSPFEMRIA